MSTETASVRATVITDFPNAVQEVEHAWIPLADGTRLAVRMWLPIDADTQPVPAILEYIPYCKRDGTAARDEAMHPFFAGHGYAAVRVDMRGSGESDGIMLDEYLKLEQDDALEVIAWIAAQAWCDGQVGMMGKSWGGFNGLQVAALKPPALKCVISVYSTDDRYADDVHYMGGCLLADNPSWAFTMFEINSRPPDSALVGEGWRDMWMARLEANRPWLIDWLRHQTRDAYWRHGSVCEDYDAIDVPVYAMGGWADSYSNTVPRLLANLSSPCKGLVGPWGHQYMHQAVPGPKMSFPEEALRWWDHWLKGKDTGVMEEPAYRVWMQESIEPRTVYFQRPGRWVTEESWPSARVTPRRLALNHAGLEDAPDAGGALVVCSGQTVGTSSLFWGDDGGGAAHAPRDQREDDARSLCFDTEPLAATLEILGAPRVLLEVETDQANAFVCVRLCDVAPDGASTRISFGLLNLTHRCGHETPEPMVRGRRYRVEVVLNDIAHKFKTGHRVRVAVSTSFWPMVWPSSRPVTLSLYPGVSVLELPVRPTKATDNALSDVPAATMSAVEPVTTLRPPKPTSVTVSTDLATGLTEFRQSMDGGSVRGDRNGWRFGGTTEVTQRIRNEQPNSAEIELRGEVTYGRDGECDVRVELSTRMTADHENFHVHARIDAYDHDQPVFARSWLEKIPRNGV